MGTGESMRDPAAEGIAYSAGAAAPPTPGVTGDREVGIGPSFMPVAPDDTMMAESVDPLDPYSAADAQQTSSIREPGTVRSRSGAQPAIPAALNPLRWFLEIVRGVFLKGLGVAELWRQYATLAAMAAATLLLATRRFGRALA